MVQACRMNMIETVLESSAFRKYIHYAVYLLLIFAKKAKRKIFETLDIWKMAEISRGLDCFEKQDFVFCALSAA